MDLAQVPWEAPAAAITRQMAAEPGTLALRSGANRLNFQGGALGGHPVELWQYTLAANGKGPQLVIRFARAASGVDDDFLRVLTEANGAPDRFENDVRRDALWQTGQSAAFPGTTRQIVLTTITGGDGQGVALTFFDLPLPLGESRSDLRYVLHRDPHPTPADAESYRHIADSMDRATRFYNRYTAGIVKGDTVSLNQREATADGNINGNIRFGPDDISFRCALHEIAHTAGIGTTPAYHRLTVNGEFTGRHALERLRAITGDPHAVLHADTWHFWPYGLNHIAEDHSIWDDIYHCQMVSAILQDCREFR